MDNMKQANLQKKQKTTTKKKHGCEHEHCTVNTTGHNKLMLHIIRELRK